MKEIANALQEAQTLLERIHNAFADSQGDISIHRLRETLSAVNSVLAKPLRNCDVGTAEEQSMRYHDYCLYHSKMVSCSGCPLNKEKGRCEFIWANLPYKEEEANEYRRKF